MPINVDKNLAIFIVYFRNIGVQSDFGPCGDPNIKFDVSGGVLEYNGEWQITCDSKTAIPSELKINCVSRKNGSVWIQKSALHCYQPPAMPDFLEAEEIMDFETKFLCMNPNKKNKNEKRYQNWSANGRHAHVLYKEALKYLEGYAIALTTNDGHCRNSDETMTQTNTHNYEGRYTISKISNNYL